MLNNTKKLRDHLEIFCKLYNITSITDVACGDFNWMSHVDLTGIEYLGCDIAKSAIDDNNFKSGNLLNVNFKLLNAVEEEIPTADLVIARDVLVHLTNEQVFSFLNNVINSGSKYFMTTCFVKNGTNEDLKSANGSWRSINLMKHPFNFPIPYYLFNEDESDKNWNDKSQCIWKIESLKNLKLHIRE